MTQISPLENQMKTRDREMVPRILVQAMFGLMFASLCLVAYAQWADVPQAGVPERSEIVAEREITLMGSNSDGVRVLAADGAELAYSRDGKSGFIDVVWLGLKRERKINGAEADAPVRLVRRANGRTAILDDTTGWSIELIGYGQNNIDAFAKLID
ncbi:MAG: photosynthetic complex assembly protein PuhC [Pseudomonadota bacterium]